MLTTGTGAPGGTGRLSAWKKNGGRWPRKCWSRSFVTAAVKAGDIRHFFLVAGCDGAKPGRNYYTEFVEKVPRDGIVLTRACGKYRFFLIVYRQEGRIDSMKPLPTDSFLRSNTILYCQHWRSTVTFYRDVLGLGVNHEADWLVEFHLPGKAYLSVADASRTSIPSAKGRGFTLSLRVRDLDRSHALLGQGGIEVSTIRPVWGTRAFYFYDPEGHRIELWA